MTEAKKHPGIFGANAPGRGERSSAIVFNENLNLLPPVQYPAQFFPQIHLCLSLSVFYLDITVSF